MNTGRKGPVARDLHGLPITVDDLPSPDTRRWVPNRKAIVVNAVRGGLISLEEVLIRYNMTEREFRIWEQGLEDAGAEGLKTTKFQKRKRRA
ncbi:MAG: hypothetical protein AB202_01810 [Parcubacteria bacterium C7867-007]|nr:MAG: hypothetical protein AB202_01810 [Parcubacteria bacterium C7867-007]